jgi:type IV pilus assembly protein PilM
VSLQGPDALEPVPASPAPARARSSRRARGRGATLTGLDIEPGLLVAARSHLNGGLHVEHAAFLPVGIDVVRDGEVADVSALTTALVELFKDSHLDRRVRIGIANQRIMMRRIELPPLTQASEIQQAVQFQAQDEIPMPLNTVVLDYQALGIVERDEGPRLQVMLVAARREMVERVLHAARLAGLQPEGVDLAAFGMIRALHPAGAGEDEAIAYLCVGGLTNLAIARGLTCEFTRVIPAGVEQLAADVATRCAVSIDEARALLVSLPATPETPQAGSYGFPVGGTGVMHESATPIADQHSIARNGPT